MDIYFTVGVVLVVVGIFLLAIARFGVKKPVAYMNLDFSEQEEAEDEADSEEDDDYFDFIIQSLKLFFYGLAIFSIVLGIGLMVFAAIR